jgi:GMP synthase-like glutamine amidotransferase
MGTFTEPILQATTTANCGLPFGRKSYSLWEPIRPRIKALRVALVNNLLIEDFHFSDEARALPQYTSGKWMKYERKISSLALANIESNVLKLVEQPTVRTVHFSELSSDLVGEFKPDAIVLSGTLSDFDFYNPDLLARFAEFIRATSVPVLAICGGHQMVGQAFGAQVITLDRRPARERRQNRQMEYQYRYVKITDDSDPIFKGICDPSDFARWHEHTKLMRVWQNHGLQLDRVPDGFRHLARGYLSEVQMMVRRTDAQLIYGVQFHIEKSFQDWHLDNYWEHRLESRDGRLIFENFLIEAERFNRSH